MKKLALIAMLALSAGATLSITSCSKDDDNGTCPVGFSGSNCATENSDHRVKYATTWSAQWTNIADNTKTGTYTGSISLKSGSTTDVVINKSFFDNYFNHDLNATVTDNTINIPNQAPDGTSSIVGTGVYNTTSHQIVWSYSIMNNGATKAYSDIWK